MTIDDKNAQIGVAVSEYQAAKVDLAHIEQKIERVFLAYREAGSMMDRQKRSPLQEPTIVDGKISFGWYTTAVTAADILNEADLLVLVAERDKARQRLKVAKDRMNNLGIVGMS